MKPCCPSHNEAICAGAVFFRATAYTDVALAWRLKAQLAADCKASKSALTTICYRLVNVCMSATKKIEHLVGDSIRQMQSLV